MRKIEGEDENDDQSQGHQRRTCNREQDAIAEEEHPQKPVAKKRKQPICSRGPLLGFFVKIPCREHAPDARDHSVRRLRGVKV